tara:strand:+ start:978 stop:1400 length:423 start_codon:yes stop_codon:yes gene_type:complete
MLDMKDMKKELVIELNMIGEWFSRGERGIDEWYEDVNVDKIRKVWNSREDEDELDEGGLNAIEERILVGDGGFIWDDDENYKNSRRGIEGCMGRVDELLEGKSIMIECEEEVFCIGSNNSKEINKVEIDFMKGKIELLER